MCLQHQRAPASQSPPPPTAPPQSCSPCTPGPRLWEGLDGRGQSWEPAQLLAPGGSEVLILGRSACPALGHLRRPAPGCSGGSLGALSCSRGQGSEGDPVCPSSGRASGSASSQGTREARAVRAGKRVCGCARGGRRVCRSVSKRACVHPRACEQTACGGSRRGPAPTSASTALAPSSSFCPRRSLSVWRKQAKLTPKELTGATRASGAARSGPCHAGCGRPRPPLA